jgi:serine protease AprX
VPQPIAQKTGRFRSRRAKILLGGGTALALISGISSTWASNPAGPSGSGACFLKTPRTAPVATSSQGCTAATYRAEKDAGSLYTVEAAIGARGLWAKQDRAGRPLTGKDVGVAVLDSGVRQVAGLDGAGQVTVGPDLSIEGNGPLTQQDTYGHGTFMAGIIAGRGTSSPSSDLAKAPANVQLGVAPDAKLLALKLATTDGSTDVSQVIAALDWVTQHPVLPDGTPIRVINLSYGTNSAQSYRADPLAAAAENAWRHGIVVVTSAGDSEADTDPVTNPATDPFLIAVGATNSNKQTNGWSSHNTKAASYSEMGSNDRQVDLLAPGTSVVSLRAPGSFVDVHSPSGLVSGDVSKKLFRGSGTSQAAAVVSGSVALLLQAYPRLTPDQVKFALTSSTDPVKGAGRTSAGAGTLNLAKAFDAASQLSGKGKVAATVRNAAVQTFPHSSGLGSINAARGGSFLVDATGKELSGEIDVQGNKWNAAAWRKASTTLSSWSGGKWMGNRWTGDNWQPAASGPSSSQWSSARWSSARWSSARWSSARWSSARWSSARWSSARWSSARWS